MEPPAVAYPKCRKNAEKARTLDPTLAEPWATLAGLESVENNWNKADEMFSHSISLNKNYATAWHWRGGVNRRKGSLDKAIEYIRKAHELDPKSPIITSEMGRCHLYSGKPMESIPYFQKAYELSDNENTNFILLVAMAHLYLNDPQKGIEVINQNIKDITQNNRALAFAARCEANLGNKGRAYEHLSALLHRYVDPDQYISEQFIADVFAELKEKDKAMFWLDRGIENNSPDDTVFIVKPVYEQWRNEPKYRALLKKANLDNP